ncbi:MAG: WbqC family protein [Nitrosotalea sp.]
MQRCLVSISQPTLFPWIGYFNIIKSSDTFVFFDNVKFEKRSWQMRNRIKSGTKDNEKEIWVRIPTKLEKFETMIKDVLIDNSQDWKKQHMNAFRSSYGKSWEDITFLKEMYLKDWENLTEFNIEFITNCCKFLDIKTTLLRASNLKAEGKRSSLLLNICKELGATDYLTSIGARDYLEKDRNMFETENIKIHYHDYTHTIYKQHGKTFMPQLSVLDLLFNEKENANNFI